jgi:hypothetical protein
MKFNPHVAALLAGMCLLMMSEAIYESRKKRRKLSPCLHSQDVPARITDKESDVG